MLKPTSIDLIRSRLRWDKTEPPKALTALAHCGGGTWCRGQPQVIWRAQGKGWDVRSRLCIFSTTFAYEVCSKKQTKTKLAGPLVIHPPNNRQNLTETNMICTLWVMSNKLQKTETITVCSVPYGTCPTKYWRLRQWCVPYESCPTNYSRTKTIMICTLWVMSNKLQKTKTIMICTLWDISDKLRETKTVRSVPYGTCPTKHWIRKRGNI